MFKHTLILTFLCTLSLQAQFTFDSNTPAAVANNIALDANITLNFSDNTKTASITAANIVITGRYTGILQVSFLVVAPKLLSLTLQLTLNPAK
jgi:hypothetical protein